MSYFFPITAELVAPLESEKRARCDNCDIATRRTAANANRRNVADVATPPVLQCDWREYFEERAAIREHDGGMSRADAEVGALADCVARWRALNPLPASTDSACIHCGKARPDTPVLACGGHAWLHRACWAPLNAAQNEAARKAVLAALVIGDT